MDYLPDRFTAFHEPMEEFADVVVKPGSEATKQGLLKELADLWRPIEEARLDAKLFRVSPERAARYAEQVRKEREILTRLKDLIGSGNQADLVKTVTAMKGNFAQAYFVFGDFSGLQ